jgi:tetratricopeptide (TPR) repeat protein
MGDIILEWINVTRWGINSELKETVSWDPEFTRMLQRLSQTHYRTELDAMFHLSRGYASRGEEKTAEKYVALFGKRVEEIETIFKRVSWDLKPVRSAKTNYLEVKCELYERQGKQELALDILSSALKESEDDVEALGLFLHHAHLSLEMGRIEQALRSKEKWLSSIRYIVKTSDVGGLFEEFLACLPEESEWLFEELIPQYPHVLWAANAADFVELSKEENKALRSRLEAKLASFCLNCRKELTKIYRCSRCDIATYCGSACQKEAWKEHKKICKEKEEKE